jgi:16S rRNA processing protein RimM
LLVCATARWRVAGRTNSRVGCRPLPDFAGNRRGAPARRLHRRESPAVIDRNAAEALRGARLFVSRASFPASAEDEFYWVDLIGLTVVNRDGLQLGTVVGLLDTGPAQRAEGAAGKRTRVQKGPVDERLIPFVGAYVDTVDLAGRRITVDWGADF